MMLCKLQSARLSTTVLLFIRSDYNSGPCALIHSVLLYMTLIVESDFAMQRDFLFKVQCMGVRTGPCFFVSLEGSVHL